MKPFLSAEWRKLAIANYIIDPALLKPHLPYQTELDIWNGKCFVSLVAFMFQNTKLKGLSIPFYKNFEEINLRFYVKHFDGNEWKRGVVFIKEIVPKYALSFVANSFYGEKYVTLPTKHTWENIHDGLHVKYQWKFAGKWNRFSVVSDQNPVEILSGSKEEFITEHYWGYTRLKNNRSSEYGVEHPKWDVYPVRSFEIDVNFSGLYGSEFSYLENAAPASVMLAEGSPIFVMGKKTLS